MRKYFDIRIAINFQSYKTVKMHIILENNSSRGFYVAKDTIYGSGINSEKFVISGNSPIQCNIRDLDYGYIPIFIAAQSKLSNTVNLAEVCNFNDLSKGVYFVKFTTFIMPCATVDQQKCDAGMYLQDANMFLVGESRDDDAL